MKYIDAIESGRLELDVAFWNMLNEVTFWSLWQQSPYRVLQKLGRLPAPVGFS